MSATHAHGPTVSRGSAGIRLAEGERGEIYASAGQTGLGDSALCGTAHASSPDDPAVSSKALERVRSYLQGDGYVWKVAVRFVERDADSVSLVVERERTRITDGRSELSHRTIELSLRVSETRLLEAVPFAAPLPAERCPYESYSLELRVEPLPHPEMRGRDLVAELWFATTRDGRREEVEATEILFGQAESVQFRVPAVARRLGRSSPGDGGFELRSQCKGRLLVWSIAPDRVAVRIDPGLTHRIAPPFLFEIGSGSGSKLYEAALGETVELAIPPAQGSVVTLPLPDGDSSLLEVDGVEQRGGALAVDLGKLLADVSYSLMVRVRAAE
jgi:hypothetical protein